MCKRLSGTNKYATLAIIDFFGSNMFRVLAANDRQRVKNIPPSGHYYEFASYFGLFDNNVELDALIRSFLYQTINLGEKTEINDRYTLCQSDHLNCMMTKSGLVSCCLNPVTSGRMELKIDEVLVWDKSESSMAFVKGVTGQGREIVFLATDYIFESERYAKTVDFENYKISGLASAAETWNSKELEQMGLSDRYCNYSNLGNTRNPNFVNVLGRVVALTKSKSVMNQSFKIITMQMFSYKDPKGMNMHQTVTFLINEKLLSQTVSIGDNISVNMFLFGQFL